MVEIDMNRILEYLAEKMQSILHHDLSAETVNTFDEIDKNEFYDYALQEILINFNAVEIKVLIDDAFEEMPATLDTPDKIYQELDYSRALHAACDHFLATQFFY